MDKENIIEMAERYGQLETLDDQDTGCHVSAWVFGEEGLRKFVQAVVDEERKRIKQIVDEVSWKGDHDKWFDCLDALVERIEQ
jgi:hypothetical protein